MVLKLIQEAYEEPVKAVRDLVKWVDNITDIPLIDRLSTVILQLAENQELSNDEKFNKAVDWLTKEVNLLIDIPVLPETAEAWIIRPSVMVVVEYVYNIIKKQGGK